jgi:glycosyltransferase involved in cell wall biosynthesis
VKDDIRVLWFADIEFPAVRRRLSLPAIGRGGWIESLRQALRTQEGLQLGVAAKGLQPFEPFDEDGVRYYWVAAPPAKNGIAEVLRRWRHRLDDQQVLMSAATVIRDFQPDLIHVHGSEGVFGLLGSTRELPVLVSLQGLLAVISRFYFAGLPLKEVSRRVFSVEFLKGGGLVHGLLDMRLDAGREMRILRSCRFFAGRTDWDRGVLSVINPDAHYYHSEEVLRPEFYGRCWKGRWDDEMTVYTTASYAPYKGVLNLLEALALLKDSSQREVKLRVGGQIRDTAVWPIVRRAVNRLDLADIITWLGPLSPAGIADELERASVYVHPSLIDNSPNALAEAMIVGVPCVASSAGGIPSMISDGIHGLLYGPNDVYGLAARIAAIDADPNLAGTLSSNARARAQLRHEPGAVAGATIEMYADILACHRSGKR